MTSTATAPTADSTSEATEASTDHHHRQQRPHRPAGCEGVPSQGAGFFEAVAVYRNDQGEHVCLPRPSLHQPAACREPESRAARVVVARGISSAIRHR